MSDGGDPLGNRELGLVMASALAALAGAVDAAGLVRLRDIFVSFMSGNTTSLGTALGGGDWPRAGLIAGLIALFVAGAAAGEMLAVAAGRWRLPAVTLAVAAGLAAPLAAPSATVAAMVVSMGALNAAMQRAGGASVGLTYVTGALVRLGRGAGQTLCRQEREPGWLRQAAPWAGLLAGAAAATALGPAQLWPLPAAALGLAAVAWLLER